MLVQLGEKERQKTHNLFVRTILDLHNQDKLVVELQDSRDRFVKAKPTFLCKYYVQ